MRLVDDASVSAAEFEPELSVGVLTSPVLAAVTSPDPRAFVEPALCVGILIPLEVSAATLEPALSVGKLTSSALAEVASADARAFVIVEKSLGPVAEAAEASKVVLKLEAAKVG